MTHLMRFDPIAFSRDGKVMQGEMSECSDGEYVRFDDYEKCDRERRDLIDTVKAVLVACGGSSNDAELEQQCKAAGDKPSDFIAAVGGRLLKLISEWQASGRYGYCLPVIQVELMDDIERILRGECNHAWKELNSQFSNDLETAVVCEKCGLPGNRDNASGEVFYPAT